MEPTQSASDAIYAAITVDGDLRVGDHHQQTAGFRAMRQVHADLELLGRTTWFINEYDFQWTVYYRELLQDLLDSGEALGIHDHFDTHFADDEEDIFRIAKVSKRRLEQFLQKENSSRPVVIHRNGCALQSRAIYHVLKKLGYRILSDVRPETEWSARMIPVKNTVMAWECLIDPRQGAIQIDNLSIPLGAVPWQHDEENWLDFQGSSGTLLQVPITSMPWVDKQRVKTAVEQGGPRTWIVIDTHPYDLQDPVTGNVDAGRVKKYTNQLIWLQERYQPTFLGLDQVPAVLNLW